MAVSVTDYGVWMQYVPDVMPELPGVDADTVLPPGMLFCRGPNGEDWYQFRATWPAGALCAVVLAGGMVGAVRPSAAGSVVPFNMRVLGIAGHDPADPNPGASYSGKIYDSAKKTFTATSTAPVITYKADIWRRMTTDEATAIYADLQDADVKMRATFEAAQYIDHSDDLFPLLQASISARTGPERAAVILAPS